MVERLDTPDATQDVTDDVIRNAICDGTRQVTIVLPDDLPNSTYANLVRGLQGLLHTTELGPRATIHPDPHHGRRTQRRVQPRLCTSDH